MTTDPHLRTTLAAALIPALAVLIAACSASAAADPSPTVQATPAVSASSPMTLALSSSIADGAVLTDPLEWIATVIDAPVPDAIDHVDFLIDGAVSWAEHASPYQFNDDGNLLIPSVFTPGSHTLAINAFTVSGAEATTKATVITTRPPVPANLLGKGFVRYMTGVLATSPDGSSVTMPAGDWRIEFDADGVIRIVDTWQGKPTEAFIATADGGLTLYGPANWIVPEEQRGGFCDEPADGVATMHWELDGSDLTLSTVGSGDPCAGRMFLFAGTWKLKP